MDALYNAAPVYIPKCRIDQLDSAPGHFQAILQSFIHSLFIYVMRKDGMIIA